MSNNKPYRNERAAQFIDALHRLGKDRGKLAALRRGLTSTTVMDAWPVVASLGGEIGRAGQSVYVDVAALYASHPNESNARNFGETCREIALADSSDRTMPDTFERRFRRLLASGEYEDLVSQLRSWIRLADSKNVGVNYKSLMNDLMYWNRNADNTRVHWAKAFWDSREPAAIDNHNRSRLTYDNNQNQRNRHRRRDTAPHANPRFV